MLEIKLDAAINTFLRHILKITTVTTAIQTIFFQSSNQIRSSKSKTAGNQVVDIPAANLTTNWMWIAFAHDITNGVATGWASASSATPYAELVNVSANFNNGGGTRVDDTGANLYVFNNQNFNVSAGITIGRSYYYADYLSPWAIQQQQFQLAPVAPGCVAYYDYNMNTSGLYDLSGNGHHGLITNAVLPVADRQRITPDQIPVLAGTLPLTPPLTGALSC
jgi:hypothetical protein